MQSVQTVLQVTMVEIAYEFFSDTETGSNAFPSRICFPMRLGLTLSFSELYVYCIHCPRIHSTPTFLSSVPVSPHKIKKSNI